MDGVDGVDVTVDGDRTVRVYEFGAGADAALTIFWHHGAPQGARPPDPLVAGAAAQGIRWIGHDRPGYGGSPAQPGRTVASVAADVAAIADARGVDRFAVMGASGGGPHALACAALLPDRVIAAVSIAGIAPYGAPGLDWFGAMDPANGAAFRAAAAGAGALAAHRATSPEVTESMFTAADVAALSGPYGPWLAESGAAGLADPGDGLTEDYLAFVAPWGFDAGAITVPVLIVHGDDDRVVPATHADWLAVRCPSAERWAGPGDGHLSVFAHAGAALAWLRAHRGPSRRPT